MRLNNFLLLVSFGLALTSMIGCQSAPDKKDGEQPKTVKRKVKESSEKKEKEKEKTKKDSSSPLDEKDSDSSDDGPKFKPGSAIGKKKEHSDKLENFAKNFTLKQQSKKQAAKHYYESARKHYRALRYQLAERELLTCLQYDSDHRKAKLLLSRVRYVLGDTKGAIHDVARDYTQGRKVKIAQTRIEIERLFSRAKSNFQQKNYKKAKEQFEKIMELTRFFPYHVVDDKFSERIKAWIKKTTEAKRKHDLELKRKLQEAAQEQARFLHAQNLKYVAAQVRALYRQAQLAFEREEYDAVINICDEILALRPEFRKAKIMKERAMNAKHLKKARKTIREQSEHFARQIEQVEAAAIPYQEVFRFPDRDKWKVILNRASQVTSFINEDESSAIDEDINSRLNNQTISVNFRKTPLQEAINFLRDASGLNFVISNDAERLIIDGGLRVTLPLDHVKLRNALELILKASPELTYKVKNGAVYVATRGTQKKKMIIHYYNVSGIINDLPNFPAPKLALNPSGSSGAGGPGGGGGAIGGLLPEEGGGGSKSTGVSGEKLLQLIRQRIGEAADEGSVSLSNGVLIARKPLEAHKKIQKLLEALRKTVGIMVTVEARFIDIQDNLLQEIGMDYRGLPTVITNIDGAGTNQDIGYRRLSDSGKNDIRSALVNSFSNGLGTTANNPFNLTSIGGLVLQYTNLDTFQLEAIFEAVKKKQRARLINAPRVNVFNTQRAHVLSIRQRAFVQDIEVDSAGVVPVLNPVVGILNSGSILEARPTVSHDRKYVTLEIKPTLAVDQTTAANTTTLNLAGGNTNIPIELPILTVQKIRTTVTVPDGGTILVGGLKNYQKEKKEAGVPILSNIPLVKNLFSRRGWTHMRRSLIVLLSVKIHVIRDIEDRKFGGLNLK